MTLVLQEPADCYHLLPSTQLDKNFSFQPKTYEFQLHDPKRRSHGYRRWFHLRPGISLLLEDYYLQENLVIEYCPHQPCTCLELGFNLFGYDHSIDFKTGQNFIQLALARYW